MTRTALRPLVGAALLAALPGAALGQSPAGARLVRLSADGATSIEFAGQLRLRGEYWNGFAFGAAGTADTSSGFGLSRLLASARLAAGSHVVVFAQLKSSLATNRTLPGGRRGIDEDRFDVQQLYAEVRTGTGAGTIALRAGRTDLSLGRQRLVSPLDWVNTRRTFQGASGTLSGGAGTLSAFLVRPVQVRRLTWNVADSLRLLAGTHLARPLGRGRLALEAYWLYARNLAASVNGTAGEERRHTLGARLSTRGAPSDAGWDADIEAAGQFGALGAGNIRAAMLAIQTGYRVAGLPLAPRFHVGLDLATGDGSAGGDVGTFNQLYPLAHAHLGFADVHGRGNLVDVSGGASGRAGRTVVSVDLHNFWRASAADGLYGADGAAIGARGPGAGGLSKRVGTEVDLTVSRPLLSGNRLSLQGGYSIYLPGRFIAQTGPSKTLHWFYLQTAVAL